MMDWEKLLSSTRIGKVGECKEEKKPRTDYTRDYDRIIFSSAFRRMQDKTQVFPLAKSDYIRTRLTHSLEVASVGRSLGMLAAEIIIENNPALEKKINPHHIGTIVASACLAHDIGNPPFGHAGETAIQEWFKRSDYQKGLSPAERADFEKFEGNAQGLRILCTLQQSPQRGGMQLTAATLGTFTKYPCASDIDGNQCQGISGKKFGFMQSESETFNEIANELGLIAKSGRKLAWHRHPLAFLVEAADDICYRIIDVEDGFKSGKISFEEVHDLHRPFIKDEDFKETNNLIDKKQRVECFRTHSIDKILRSAIDVFKKNYDGLMSGKFDKDLIENIDNADNFKKFSEICKEKIYVSRSVLEIEACGYEVIGGLLDIFTSAIEAKANGNIKGQDKVIYHLLPDAPTDISKYSPYERMLLATDFISGMTDSFAVELYQKIKGIKLP